MIGGFILFLTASFDATFLIVGAVGVVTFVVILLLPQEPPRAASDEPPTSRAMNFWQGLKEVLSTPAILVASGAEAPMSLGFGAFLGFLPFYPKAPLLNVG